MEETTQKHGTHVIIMQNKICDEHEYIGDCPAH